jgi:hypothetical protein
MDANTSFAAIHHANMLSDRIRIDAYARAIEAQVSSSDSVVDVGTGTGILAALAAQRTAAPVLGIEYFGSTATVAKEMARLSGLQNLQILEGRSFDVQWDASPTILVTETIGRLGPEENIVEICYDFKRRHPSISRVLPAKLSIYAEPIVSTLVEREENEFLEKFYAASSGSFRYENIACFLESSFSGAIRFSQLVDDGCEPTWSPRLLARYTLGESKVSAFATVVDIPEDSRINGLHIYFEADFGAGHKLSSHRSAPMTHWLHAYVKRPKGRRRTIISYEPGWPTFKVQWI